MNNKEPYGNLTNHKEPLRNPKDPGTQRNTKEV